MLDDLSTKYPAPSIYLDAGNSLFKKTSSANNGAKSNASQIIKALEAMKLNVLAIGPKDLSAGSPFLLNAFSNIQPLSANLLHKGTDTPVFNRYSFLDVGDKKIAVIGLTENHKDLLDKYSFSDTHETLREILELIQFKSNFVILLSNLPTSQNEAIAKNFQDIQLIISSDKSRGSIKSLPIENSIIVQTINRGKQLGFFQLELGSNKKWSQNFKDNLKITTDKLTGIDWQIKRANRINAKNPVDRQIPTEKLLTIKKELIDKIAQLEKQQALSIKEGLDSYFNCNFYKLNQRIKEKETVKNILKNI